MKQMQATDLRKDLYRALEQIASSGEPIEILKHNRLVAFLAPGHLVQKSKRKPLLDLDAIASFCKRHQVTSFALFGSILRDDFNETSDVDVLVDIQGRRLKFHEECQMVDELELMFGRKVDMVPAHVLADPHMNEHRRASIASSAKVVYDAQA
jgi:predicted nucleotidyltransferase